MNRCRKRFFDKLRAELDAQGGLARTEEAIPFQAVPESSTRASWRETRQSELQNHRKKVSELERYIMGRSCRCYGLVEACS